MNKKKIKKKDDEIPRLMEHSSGSPIVLVNEESNKFISGVVVGSEKDSEIGNGIYEWLKVNFKNCTGQILLSNGE